MESLKKAAAEKQKARERDLSLHALTDLCVMIELGGSEARRVDALGRQFQETVARLRVLQEIE